MQKIFIVRETLMGNDTNYTEVNDFIGKKGRIVSVTANFVATGGDSGRKAGRWLVVADDGEGQVQL